MAVDINELFGRAEQAFVAGKANEARALLARVRQEADGHPAIHHLAALIHKQIGDLVTAEKEFLSALQLAPDDAQINGNYANMLNSVGRADDALTYYARALAADREFAAARFNRAMLLQLRGAFDEALADLEFLLIRQPRDGALLTAKGSLLLDKGNLAAAGEAFEAALSAGPSQPAALHGRARVALQRGEADARERYAAAVKAQPDDSTAAIGFARALEAAGQPDRAIAQLAQSAARTPEDADVQIALAQLRWEAGEAEAFTRDLTAAIARFPENQALRAALVSSLAGADLFEQAANAAHDAVRQTGGAAPFLLNEALYASEAGDLDRADRLYALLPAKLPGREIQEASHRLRRGQLRKAAELVDEARLQSPASIAVWAMTSLVWRVVADPRQAWLNEQQGLVRVARLPMADADLKAVADVLRQLHRTSAHPIGQSLRGGTQTRGRLFERREPEVRNLADSVRFCLNEYWRRLPEYDPAHPLLRLRTRSPEIEGSWSVRLSGGGFHVAHFHPRGVVSSACYLVLPHGGPGEGWLDLGTPPANLNLKLDPLQSIAPVAGELVLFPSFLHHGTRPFGAGERLTAAFDVVAH